MKTRSGNRLLIGLTGALALGTAAPLAAQEPVIQLPPGYRVEKVADDLSYATSLTWDDRGRMYVVEAGGHFLEEPRPGPASNQGARGRGLEHPAGIEPMAAAAIR